MGLPTTMGIGLPWSVPAWRRQSPSIEDDAALVSSEQPVSRKVRISALMPAGRARGRCGCPRLASEIAAAGEMLSDLGPCELVDRDPVTSWSAERRDRPVRDLEGRLALP